jgi:hypothetical protein
MSADDRLADGEAQAEAVLFRRHERLEDLLHLGAGDARSAIDDRETRRRPCRWLR